MSCSPRPRPCAICATNTSSRWVVTLGGLPCLLLEFAGDRTLGDVLWANIEAADRRGPDGPDWPLLIELVRQAADGVVDDLLARRDPTLLLTWPGALARYGLASALQRIVDGAERGDAPAVLFVVPSHADGTAPSVNGQLPVPAPLPSQRLLLPTAWLENRHKSADMP